MIARVRGEVVDKGAQSLVIDTGGISYAVAVPATVAVGAKSGENILLHTHLQIRDAAHELYGFLDRNDLQFFKRLISVSGLGPKGALHLMALGNATEIQSAIARSDVTFLTSVSGIGKKTAERIVVELKGSLDHVDVEGSSGLKEVAEALMSLGYKQQEIQEVLKSLRDDGTEGSTEEILRAALQHLKKV